MKSLTELNGASVEQITFTDERDPGPLFDRPFANDVEQALSFVFEYNIEPTINIIDVIRPEDTSISYIVDVSSVPGTQVTWASIPSGCTLTQNGDVYTISGINTVAQWETVKTPTINVDTDFQGFFFYNVTIKWISLFGEKTKSWQVGYFIPVSVFNFVSNINTVGNAFYDIAKITLETSAVMTTSIVQAPLFVTSNFTTIPEVVFAIISDPLPITYGTNIPFVLINASNIIAPNQDNMTLTITPSTSSAIDSISEVTVPVVESSLNYTDPTSESFSWGINNSFAATLNNIVVCDYYPFATSEDTIVRVYDLDGNLIRSQIYDENRQTDVICNDTLYYVEADGTLYNISDGSVFRTGVPGLYDMTNTHYCFLSNGVWQVVDIATNTTISSGSLAYTGPSDPNAVGGNLPFYNCLSSNYILVRNPGSILTPNYSVYNIFTGNLLCTINVPFITPTASINDNAVAFVENTDGNSPGNLPVARFYNPVNGNLIYSDSSNWTEGLSETPFIHKNDKIFAITNDNSVVVYNSELFTVIEVITVPNISGISLSKNKILIGNANNDVIYSYNINEPIISSIDNSTKIITLNGSTDQINSLLDEGRLTIATTFLFSNDFTLTYKATRSDGKSSEEKIQQIDNF